MSARVAVVERGSAAKRQGKPAVTITLRKPAEALTPDIGERIPLPYRDLLEERFGRPLDSLEVYSGPDVRAALHRIGAVAATRDDSLYLAGPDAPLPVVAHEVAHALQRPTVPANEGVEPERSAAEREAGEAARVVSTSGLAAPVTVSEGIGAGTIALLRMGAGPAPGSETPTLDVTESTAPPATAPPTASAGQTPTAAAPSAQGGQAETEPAGEAFELPPAPELTVSAEDVAAREAALAEAEAVIAAASTANEVMDAFAAAPPSLKAQHAGSLEADVAAATTQEGTEWQTDLPELTADLSGAEAPPDAVPMLAPPAGAVDLEEGPVAPAPEPEIVEVPDPGPFEAVEDVTRAFARLIDPDPAGFAEQIGDSLSDVQTTDTDVPRSPGPPPAIPLGGETDPERIAAAEQAGKDEAAAARGEAAGGVIEGPGPERVQPRAMTEPYEVGELPTPVIAAGATIEGPDAYAAMALPPEVQVAFDEQQGAAMEASLAQATGQAEQATTERDAAKQTAVSEAEDGVTKLNAEANGKQTEAVVASRTDIQTARQATLDAQQAEVERVEGEAGDQRRLDEERIQTRVSDDQAQIDADYAKAEGDIEDKVAEGERKAEAEKEQAERDAEDQSWWDRAVNFVKDAFNALIDAIGKIFDAIRSVVNGILDAVKEAALALIDAVASFIKDAIAAFGELLKAAITGLIGQVFPELAEKLNAAIDSAVEAAQNAVDVVADGLKAGVNALVEGLRAALNKAIDIFQAGITLAVSFAAAAITGDWAGLARRVLEAVLRVAGVAPETFYAFVGRAEETLQIIIDDPLGFLGNVLAAVSGGFQRFADNIVTHLQMGVIGWLTGTLGTAGITLPAAFDLMGVLDLARQILGLTWDLLKAKARKLVGEANVERLEAVYGFIETLVVEGWGGLWNRIMESVANVRDLVFEGIKSFVLERVVIAAITKLASLFNPVGAIVQLVITAWNLYTFLRDQLARIVQVVQSVVNAIGDIARGVLEGAILTVESVLGNLLPLALDLLARILGLGNVGAKVKEIVEEVRGMVDRAIDWLLEKTLSLFKGGSAGPAAAAGAPGVPGAVSPAGAAVAPAPIGGPLAASVGPEQEIVEESFSVAGEDHTFRAVLADESEVLMASSSFAGLVSRINKFVKELTKEFLDPQKAEYVGATRAPTLAQEFTNLQSQATTFVQSMDGAERDRKTAQQAYDAAKAVPLPLSAPQQATLDATTKALKAAKAIEKDRAIAGFGRMRDAIAAFGLKGLTTAPLHGHGFAAKMPLSYGRATSARVYPLSDASPAHGRSANDPVPGIRIMDGYQRGHLVAKSLGGPGTPDNLVPMSAATNKATGGVRGVEDSLFKAIKKGYVFDYSVWGDYAGDHEPADLQGDLAGHGVARPDSGQKLFERAQQSRTASSAVIPDADLLRLVDNPAGTDPARLAANVRRRLTYYFLPKRIGGFVDITYTPEGANEPIYSPTPSRNHEEDLSWRS